MSLRITFEQAEDLRLGFEEEKSLSVGFGDHIEVAVNDYEPLKNKPQINNIELIGNKSSEELNLQDLMDSISNVELARILT